MNQWSESMSPEAFLRAFVNAAFFDPPSEQIIKAQRALEIILQERDRYRSALSKQEDEVCQTLGNALGYPWFKDDQANFPGATEENGVCVGEHVAESLAMEAAAMIGNLTDLQASDFDTRQRAAKKLWDYWAALDARKKKQP